MSKRVSRLDDAARAGWLYYVAGNTQDQIATKLGVSRQSAQRLVSLARSEGLVRVQIDHPIANCLELSNALRDRFGLKHVDVTPTDPGSDSMITGVAESASAELEVQLKSKSLPVLRADSTSCSVPEAFLTTAATTGPLVLALIASAICCLVAPAASSMLTLELPSA